MASAPGVEIARRRGPRWRAPCSWGAAVTARRLAPVVVLLAACGTDGLESVVHPDMTAPDDLGPVRAPDLWEPSRDLAYAPPLTVTMVGTHRDCSSTWSFRMDGTFTRADERNDCRSEGHFALKPGDLLDLVYDRSTCGQKPSDLLAARASQPKADLTVLVHASFNNGTSTLWGDKVPHQRWKLVGGPTSEGHPEGTQIVRIVGDPQSGIKSACYWSGDAKCNGIFSCGGGVTQWTVSNGNLLAGLSCSGQCTCGTSIVGAVDQTGDHLQAKFFGQNCMLVYQGTLVGDTLPDP